MKGLYGLEKEKSDFLSKWYVVAIYVLVDLKDFSPDPTWIAKRMGGLVSPAQAAEALENLQKLQMIEPDEKRGFKQTQGAITVADTPVPWPCSIIINRRSVWPMKCCAKYRATSARLMARQSRFPLRSCRKSKKRFAPFAKKSINWPAHTKTQIKFTNLTFSSSR